MGKIIDKIKRLFKRPAPENPGGQKVFYKNCGHFGPDGGQVTILGRTFDTQLRDEDVKIVKGVKTSFNPGCPDCFVKYMTAYAIRCCLCGRAIFPEDPMALHGAGNKLIDESKATWVGKNAIGCLNKDCCPFGELFAGHWTENGFRPAFGNGLTFLGAAVASGKSIAIGNTGDPSSTEFLDYSDLCRKRYPPEK